MRTISRQELFEDVWTRPLTKIAPEFGITDVGLRKICSRHNIPTPLRGYWAKVAAGMVFPHPKLRPARTPEREMITIEGTRPPAAEVQAAIERVRAVRSARKDHPRAEPSRAKDAAPQVPAPDLVQPDRDPVNAMLNYAYAALESRVHIAAASSGFDPKQGILHHDRDDALAFVYDMMEPERPRVDRAVLEFIDATTFTGADFVLRSDGVCRLAPQLARRVCESA